MLLYAFILLISGLITINGHELLLTQKLDMRPILCETFD
jgi:hypothetical protein